jgi:hypothetical protein
MARHVLRTLTIAALADGHVEQAVGAECELGPEMRVAGVAVVGDEQVLRPGQRPSIEPPAQ